MVFDLQLPSVKKLQSISFIIRSIDKCVEAGIL